VGQRHTPSLIEILRKTLRALEKNEEFGRNDVAVKELRRSVARAIAELEIAKRDKNAA
jgi:hypothetical protein